MGVDLHGPDGKRGGLQGGADGYQLRSASGDWEIDDMCMSAELSDHFTMQLEIVWCDNGV